MAFRWHPAEQLLVGQFLLKWTLLASVVGVLAGSASALFLRQPGMGHRRRASPSPGCSTCCRPAGLLIGLFYHYARQGGRGRQQPAPRGDPRARQPACRSRWPRSSFCPRWPPTCSAAPPAARAPPCRWAAVWPSWFARLVRPRPGARPHPAHGRHQRRLRLGVRHARWPAWCSGWKCWPSAGIRYDALIPCLVASLVGDWTCSRLGRASHALRRRLGAAADALAGRQGPAGRPWPSPWPASLFAELTHALQRLFKHADALGAGPSRRWAAWPSSAWSGSLGTRDYLGLGVPLIVRSFEPGRRGGLGLRLEAPLHGRDARLRLQGRRGDAAVLHRRDAGLHAGAPAGRAAGLHGGAGLRGRLRRGGQHAAGLHHHGDRAVRRRSTRSYLAVACCAAYVWSGHRGIYLSQVIDTPKTH